MAKRLPLADEKVSMDNGDDKGLPTGSVAALREDCTTPQKALLDAKITSRTSKIGLTSCLLCH